MTARATVSAGDAVRRAVERLLPVTVTAPPTPVGRGFGNENWLAATTGGRVLVKVAPPGANVEKMVAASRARASAVAAGAPVPRELALDPACEPLAGRVVRITEYVDGVHPVALLSSPAATGRFFASAGEVVGRLHAVRCEAFSSRVGGTPGFATWVEYVAYRVPQILERGRSVDVLPEPELAELLDRALDVAAQVSPVVEPRLTHRDLHLDNLVADPVTGRVAAVVDFDNAEAWDPVADLVTLRWRVFPAHPGAERGFAAGYRPRLDGVPMLRQRLWVADVLELSNHAVGACIEGRRGAAARARARLAGVVAAGP